jgi:hypothetical protein
MPVTGVIDFLEEEKFVVKIHMTNGGTHCMLACKIQSFTSIGEATGSFRTYLISQLFDSMLLSGQ